MKPGSSRAGAEARPACGAACGCAPSAGISAGEGGENSAGRVGGRGTRARPATELGACGCGAASCICGATAPGQPASLGHAMSDAWVKALAMPGTPQRRRVAISSVIGARPNGEAVIGDVPWERGEGSAVQMRPYGHG
jgi:hypothetical protein